MSRESKIHLPAPESAATVDKRHLPWYYLLTRIRRGGYVFVTWVGDHGPRHVHVYRDGSLALKWDLENGRVMQGEASRRLTQIIMELEAEGEL